MKVAIATCSDFFLCCWKGWSNRITTR